ncbi:MAG TPA: dihydrodipicolinate synthase family protein, partial [Pseudomonadota bacterium]|nr:dihydrodipicolinate synthase family protein [Pseudomonadota bacterium]
MAQASAARFSGVFTALVTPMQKGSGPVPEIDEAALVRLVEAQVRGGVQGLVACGTTGEAAAMTADEQAKVIRIVVDAAAGRVPV